MPVLPGHGPALGDCAAAATFYLEHRLARLDQVRAARAAGARTAAEEVVATVYADVDRSLWPAGDLLGAGPAGLPRPGIDRNAAGGWTRRDLSGLRHGHGARTLASATTAGRRCPPPPAARPPSGGSSPCSSATCPTSPRGRRASTLSGSARSPTGCWPRWPARCKTFGGHVDKLTGDGIMAVFGAPVAHEDDPERAVRAALAMQRAVRRVLDDERGGGAPVGPADRRQHR